MIIGAMLGLLISAIIHVIVYSMEIKKYRKYNDTMRKLRFDHYQINVKINPTMLILELMIFALIGAILQYFFF